MEYFIAVGILSLVMGIFFIFAPEMLRTINEMSSRMVSRVEEAAFTYRIGIGLFLVIASLLFFFVAYYITR